MATPITVGSAGGEYMEAVVILEWGGAVGDSVAEGDVIVTVETAKAATEITAPCDGILTAVFAGIGDEVPVSEVLGLVGVDLDDTEFEGASPAAESTPGPVVTPVTSDAPSPVSTPAISATARLRASPAARREAARRDIDLNQLSPSSPTGRIKLRDIARAQIAPAPATYFGAQTSVATGLPADESGSLRLYRSGSATGVPVLMIHGFGSDAMSWYPLEKTLSKAHPVIRFDLPNHGQSPRRRIAQFRALAREIVDAFDALNLETAHVVGHSLGGACALALADIRPRRIASLSLIAPGGLGPEISGAFVDGLARASHPESLGQWLKFMVADPDLIAPDFVMAAMASRSDPGLRAAQQQMARDLFPDGTQGFDLTAALDRLLCPTRIIWGRDDRVIPWRNALRAPGNAALHLLKNVGHVPHAEATQEVLRILRSVFSEGQLNGG